MSFEIQRICIHIRFTCKINTKMIPYDRKGSKRYENRFYGNNENFSLRSAESARIYNIIWRDRNMALRNGALEVLRCLLLVGLKGTPTCFVFFLLFYRFFRTREITFS